MSLVIGLTGGIATGKSTVTSYLRKLGYTVIDADVIARKVVEPGTVGLHKVVDYFGTAVLTTNGQLNRSALAQQVFHSKTRLTALNGILQPLIRKEIVEELSSTRSKLIFLDAPLLFEQHYDELCDQILVVSVDPAVQLQRLMVRDRLSKADAQARIDSQLSLTEKCQRADVVIDNNGDVEKTQGQVDRWLMKIRQT